MTGTGAGAVWLAAFARFVAFLQGARDTVIWRIGWVGVEGCEVGVGNGKYYFAHSI